MFQKFVIIVLTCVSSVALADECSECCNPWFFYAKGGVGSHFGSSSAPVIGVGGRYRWSERWQGDLSACAEFGTSELYTAKALALLNIDRSPYHSFYAGAGLGYGYSTYQSAHYYYPTGPYRRPERHSMSYLSLDFAVGCEFYRSGLLHPFFQVEVSKPLSWWDWNHFRGETYTLFFGIGI